MAANLTPQYLKAEEEYRRATTPEEEVAALQTNLIVSEQPPLGRDRFEDWAAENADMLGRRYVSELARNFRPYAPL